MDTIFTFLTDHLFELLMGGGLITWYYASENKRTIKIDNDKKVIDELVEQVERMKRDMAEMRSNYEDTIRAKDNEIFKLNERLHEAEKQLSEQNSELIMLRAELDSMKNRRAANGRFVKKQKPNETK